MLGPLVVAGRTSTYHTEGLGLENANSFLRFQAEKRLRHKTP